MKRTAMIFIQLAASLPPPVEKLRATRDRLKREILEEKMMNSLTELVFELDDGKKNFSRTLLFSFLEFSQ